MPRFVIGDRVQIKSCATYPKAVGRTGRVSKVISNATCETPVQYELAMRGRPANTMPSQFPEDALEFQSVVVAAEAEPQNG